MSIDEPVKSEDYKCKNVSVVGVSGVGRIVFNTDNPNCAILYVLKDCEITKEEAEKILNNHMESFEAGKKSRDVYKSASESLSELAETFKKLKSTPQHNYKHKSSRIT